MKNIKFLIPFLFIPSVALADPTATARRDIGGWEVTEYTEDGKYTHCTMGTQYVAATKQAKIEMRGEVTALIFKINRDNMLIVHVVNPDWKLKVGTNYKFRMEFPDGAWHQLGGLAEEETGMMYVINMDKTALELFGRISSAASVRLLLNDQSLGGFNLKKSRAAMDALIECHGKNMENVSSDVTVDPSFGGGAN